MQLCYDISREASTACTACTSPRKLSKYINNRPSCPTMVVSSLESDCTRRGDQQTRCKPAKAIDSGRSCQVSLSEAFARSRFIANFADMDVHLSLKKLSYPQRTSPCHCFLQGLLIESRNSATSRSSLSQIPTFQPSTITICTPCPRCCLSRRDGSQRLRRKKTLPK